MAAAIRYLDLLIAAMAISLLIAAVVMQRQVARTLRSRIGADDTHLLYDPGTGQIERHEGSSVLTDKAQLLVGHHLIALVRPPFPAEQLSGVILARLPPTSFVKGGRLPWTALRRGNRSLRAVAAIICAMTVIQLLRYLRPEWFTAAWEAYFSWIRASVS